MICCADGAVADVAGTVVVVGALVVGAVDTHWETMHMPLYRGVMFWQTAWHLLATAMSPRLAS